MDVRTKLIAAHNNNLMRYRRLLTTPLTEHERAYVKRRMDEERRELERLEAEARPAALSAWPSALTANGLSYR